ncbi:hypothetical protein Tco_0439795 [Tanacetum coccineum]
MTGNSLSVSSLFQSSYDLHKSLTPSLEETFSNGLITEDDNIAANSVILTPFFEENKVLLKLVEGDKGNENMEKYCELLDVYQRMKYSKKGSEGFMQVVSDKTNGNSLGYWTFHIWNWPKRKKYCVTIDIWKWPRKKKACQTNYKLKYRGWKFDIWKWPDRKKNLVDSLLLARRQVLDGVKASLLQQFAHLVTLMEDKLSISISKEIHGQDLLETWIEQDVESLNKWKGLMVYVAVQESHGCVDKATWELFMFGFDYGKSNFLKRDGMRSVWLKISTNMEGVCFDSSSNARTDGDHCKVMNYNELRYYTMWLMTDVCCITDSNDSRGQESFQGRWNDTNRFVSVGHVVLDIIGDTSDPKPFPRDTTFDRDEDVDTQFDKV